MDKHDSGNTLMRPETPSETQLPTMTLMERMDNIALKTYVRDLADLSLVPLDVPMVPDVTNDGKDALRKMTASDQARFFRVAKLVYDSDENNIHKLTSVYSAAAAISANPAMILLSDGQTVEMYLGICGEEDRNKIRPKAEALYGNIIGHFQGSLEPDAKPEKRFLSNKDLQSVMNRCFSTDKAAISSVTGIASLREDTTDDNASFSQGIEKLLDTMRGNPFSALFIANAVSPAELMQIRSEYEQLYTALFPLARQVQSINASRSESVSFQVSETKSDTKGTSQSHALSIGTNHSETHTEGTAITHTDTAGASIGTHKGAGIGVNGIGVNAGVSKSVNYSHSYSRTHSESDAVTEGNSTTNTDTISVNAAHSDAKTTGRIDGVTDTHGQTLQISYENKTITNLLENLDMQLGRIRASESYGMFAAAAYFIAPQKATAEMAACAYKSLISGKNTGLETVSVNTWTPQNGMESVSEYLRLLRHPTFALDADNAVTPAALVSAQELAIQMGLPNQSASGVTVIESAAFGRNIAKLDAASEAEKAFRLGCLYHMGLKLADSPVRLDVQSLSMHTFVTGSTGAGKTNTVCRILDKLRKNKVNFLVIEPAKGEYKHAFGDDVQIYGTNPSLTSLLRIDPFRFPKGIHILEHLDRLVEIFNVCWPMYAAMPAVLKDAVERAYIASGWDLQTSCNRLDDALFPTFADVLDQIQTVLNESAFSADNKGDYTGALTVRLRSLTNGVNGMIFTPDALTDAQLFDGNVIVDLSRIGSTETKALIMGLLVMQLQEYRMVQSGGESRALQHVTVLEEAHNLLKRTSTEQSADSANLAGKSVEMLANAIAEMRAFGEGFIIADQSPGLMDMSVIRNTNTKIIMRLPDQGDRELVGRAAGLNDSQIAELSRLGTGVAAVYQNNWLEAVLCKVDRFEAKGSFRPAKVSGQKAESYNTMLSDALAGRIDRIDRTKLLRAQLPGSFKRCMLELMQSGDAARSNDTLGKAIYAYFNARDVLPRIKPNENISAFRRTVCAMLEPSPMDFSETERNMILFALLHEQSIRDSAYTPLYVDFSKELRGING